MLWVDMSAEGQNVFSAAVALCSAAVALCSKCMSGPGCAMESVAERRRQ